VLPESQKKAFAETIRSCIQSVLASMMGYVALPDILKKIVQEQAHARYAEYKDIILGILDTYNYQRILLQTTNHIILSDLYQSTNVMGKNNMKKKIVIKPCEVKLRKRAQPASTSSQRRDVASPVDNRSPVSASGTDILDRHHVDSLEKVRTALGSGARDVLRQRLAASAADDSDDDDNRSVSSTPRRAAGVRMNPAAFGELSKY